ncbi:hypothetical protein AURDEDRAFT_127367 [Auricularia subglabra TFB-10046 SS5]|uniref:F-box domain-containing protein n=1 Tax=Auricularia subglabra (strain TFB-10046 / SS5) TaxID=717982 RepID=J0WX31_AURST|nr:hypothetical protein AURDEDRAFT_127367 [Auricularia subglabra TFB-10046 SS5]
MGHPIESRLPQLCEQVVAVLVDAQKKSICDAYHVSSVKQAVIRDIRRALVLQGRQVRKLGSYEGDLHRFLDLPLSTLHRILCFLEVEDCVAVSETCTILNEVCVAHRPLWATLVLQKRPFQDVIRGRSRSGCYQRAAALLRRSFPDPIHATFAMDIGSGEYSETLLGLLAESIPQAATLNLEVYQEGIFHTGVRFYDSLNPPPVDAWSTSLDALCQPARFLHTLRISRREYSTTDHLRDQYVHAVSSVPLNTNVLGGVPGELRVCCLRGINIPIGGCAALAMLRTFDYRPVRGRLRSSQLLDILRHLPRLEVLGLTLIHFEDDTDWSCFRHHSLSRVSTMSYLHTLDTGTPIHPLFLHLGVHTLYILDDTYSLDPLVELFGTPEEMRVSADGTTQVFDLICGTSQLWIPSYPVCDLAEFPTVLFQRMTTLTLHESLWDISAVPPQAPALVSLHIIFRPYRAAEQMVAGPAGPRFCTGIFSGMAEAPWGCPMLEEVAFSFSGPSRPREPAHCIRTCAQERDARVGPGTISLSDIATFIRTAVAFNAPRLLRLRLYGVSDLADPDPGAALSCLQTMVDEIESFDFCDPKARGLFDFQDALLQPPARHFDSAVHANDKRLPSY